MMPAMFGSGIWSVKLAQIIPDSLFIKIDLHKRHFVLKLKKKRGTKLHILCVI